MYVHLQFGSGKGKADMTKVDFQKLLKGLRNYNEADLKQHQKKLWCLIGLATGTRGQE